MAFCCHNFVNVCHFIQLAASGNNFTLARFLCSACPIMKSVACTAFALNLPVWEAWSFSMSVSQLHLQRGNIARARKSLLSQCPLHISAHRNMSYIIPVFGADIIQLFWAERAWSSIGPAQSNTKWSEVRFVQSLLRRLTAFADLSTYSQFLECRYVLQPRDKRTQQLQASYDA